MSELPIEGSFVGAESEPGGKKAVYEWDVVIAAVTGDFDESVETDATTGTFDGFVYISDGRQDLEISDMDVSADRLGALGAAPAADDFFGAIFEGRDKIVGSKSADVLSGFAGADGIDGRGGDDDLSGGDGKDKLSGGQGDDALDGGARGDKLRGGAGTDVLNGGEGRDILVGGGGADTFEFELGYGRDRIKDFRLWQGDKIDLDSLLGDAGDSIEDIVRDHARVAHGGIVLDFGDGDVLRIDGIRDIDALIENGLADSGDALMAS